MGIYGNSPFIYPVNGIGSIFKVFNRLNVRNGGTFMLNTDINRSKFATWTKFIFAYCDGAFHQGVRNAPLSYKDAKLYLRGSKITRAHFKYIQ